MDYVFYYFQSTRTNTLTILFVSTIKLYLYFYCIRSLKEKVLSRIFLDFLAGLVHWKCVNTPISVMSFGLGRRPCKEARIGRLAEDVLDLRSTVFFRTAQGLGMEDSFTVKGDLLEGGLMELE